MVKKRSRARDKTVTHQFLPILIPAAGELPKAKLLPGTVTRTRGADGAIFLQEGRLTRIQPVKRFIPSEKVVERPKRFAAIAQMYSLASGKRIDYFVLAEHFRSLFEEVFGTPFTDALSREASKNPKKVSARWLLPLFNQEIRSARLVMWWPPFNPSSPLPAIYCDDAQTALLVNLLFSGMRACLGCGELFTPHRPNQVYHDFLCANRHRKRREREKRK
jgi:hypothetical protein